MYKYIITVVIGMVLMSGCSLSHKSPIEIEQHENPMIWKEMLKTQVTLWPLEKKVNLMEKNLSEIQKNVNEMRDELATIKLSSIQANKNRESLPAEAQQVINESTRNEMTVVELPVGTDNKKEMLKTGTAKVVGASKKTDTDIQSLVIKDIEYYKVSDTQDRVLIHVNSMNNPKLQMLTGERPRVVFDMMPKKNYSVDQKFLKKENIYSFDIKAK